MSQEKGELPPYSAVGGSASAAAAAAVAGRSPQVSGAESICAGLHRLHRHCPVEAAFCEPLGPSRRAEQALGPAGCRKTGRRAPGSGPAQGSCRGRPRAQCPLHRRPTSRPLIRNATVWVGEPAEGTSAEDARAGGGYSWATADVLLEYGLIKRVEAAIAAESLSGDYVVWDAKGRQLTAGIVDMHSHAGVDSLPQLDGNEDTNEMSSDTTPYVRSIDSFQPFDHQLQVIKSGGVTTSLILPGFRQQHRRRGLRPQARRGQGRRPLRDQRHRHAGRPGPQLALHEDGLRRERQAGLRQGGRAWARQPDGRVVGVPPRLRAGSRAGAHPGRLVRRPPRPWGAENMGSYLPQELKWESLGAVLRGQVHVNTHCYTVPDLEAFIDHSNEFRFPVRAFHHAHQDLPRARDPEARLGGDPPASAMFADNMYYKAEAYVASECAGKILWENGLTPIYVSDKPRAQRPARGVRSCQGLPLRAAVPRRPGFRHDGAGRAAGAGTAHREDQAGLRRRRGRLGQRPAVRRRDARAGLDRWDCPVRGPGRARQALTRRPWCPTRVLRRRPGNLSSSRMWSSPACPMS